VPVFDITRHYSSSDVQDMLVSNSRFGSALADKFSGDGYYSVRYSSVSPDHTVVLMMKHGFTTIGTSIPEAVFRALYTQTNARIQKDMMLLRDAAHMTYRSVIAEFESLIDLKMSEKEARDCKEMNEKTGERPWRLWVREVEACPLYRNRCEL
jgi:ribulose-5-phosphate 4-epimerase/fuculose-1-phosphate aldolase